MNIGCALDIVASFIGGVPGIAASFVGCWAKNVAANLGVSYQREERPLALQWYNPSAVFSTMIVPLNWTFFDSVQNSAQLLSNVLKLR